MHGELKNSWELERRDCRRYLPTVTKSGGDQVNPLDNLLSNLGDQSRSAVLAEPFPWTVIQSIIRVFLIINNELPKSDMDLVHANQPVAILLGVNGSRIDIRIGIFRRNPLPVR